MTTFRYTVELDDDECIVLHAALALLRQECEMQIAKQPCAPYLAWHHATASIKNKIDAGAQQVSTSAFHAGFP